MSKLTRREFLKDSLFATVGAAALCTFGQGFFPSLAQAEDTIDASSNAIVRDTSLCIGCGRCMEICAEGQKQYILTLKKDNGRDVSTPASAQTLAETACIGCGQCARACPVGALKAKDELTKVNEVLSAGNKYVVWQFAPSAQHIIGEEFCMYSGEDVSAKIAAAVEVLGGKAYRTDFGADITIMEEAAEFIKCYKQGIKKPFMTSCCPGWVNYAELNYPEILDNLSTCKSPMQMLGTLIKEYLPQKYGIKREDIFSIAVMPCTAKKHEAKRPEMKTSGVSTIDAVLTVVEFSNLLKSKNIIPNTLPDGKFDTLFEGTTGAGRIFGTSGGVCEAALRTVYELLTGNELTQLEFTELRGMSGVKSTEIKIGNDTIKACVVNGIGNVQPILSDILSNRCEYDFIEVMACPGGCAGGGGTPLLFGDSTIRSWGLYKSDRSNPLRCSHNNLQLKNIYNEYLSSPLSEKAETLLHTTYNKNRR